MNVPCGSMTITRVIVYASVHARVVPVHVEFLTYDVMIISVLNGTKMGWGISPNRAFFPLLFPSRHRGPDTPLRDSAVGVDSTVCAVTACIC